MLSRGGLPGWVFCGGPSVAVCESLSLPGVAPRLPPGSAAAGRSSPAGCRVYWPSLACLRWPPVTAPFVPVSPAQGSESTSPQWGPSARGRDSARPWGWGPCFGSRIWTCQQSSQISCIAASYTCVPGPFLSRGSSCPPPCPPVHRILTLGSRVHSPVASSLEVTPCVCWPGPSPVFFVLGYAFFCFCVSQQ